MLVRCYHENLVKMYCAQNSETFDLQPGKVQCNGHSTQNFQTETWAMSTLPNFSHLNTRDITKIWQ